MVQTKSIKIDYASYYILTILCRKLLKLVYVKKIDYGALINNP